MPRKKQAESAKTRRQKLLDYFQSHPRQSRFISDVKEDLNIKNEQNLRRDLELLAEQGILDKTKDTSKLPARTVYTLNSGAPYHLQGQADDDEETFVDTQPAKAGRVKAAAKPTSEKSAPVMIETQLLGDVKGRRSARELEQRILSLLEQQPTTVKELADHLKRQQPTVTKALERMQERNLVQRKRLGRSFVYSQVSRSAAATPALAAFEPAPVVSAAPAAAVAPATAPAAPSQTTENNTATVSHGLDLQSIIETAIRTGIETGITAALNHMQKNR